MFDVIITRHSEPSGTRLSAVKITTRRKAMEYAQTEKTKGAVRAVVVQHLRSGQRRIAEL